MKTFIRKALALFLLSVSLKLLEMFWIDCYAVRRILENLLEDMILVTLNNFAGLLLGVPVMIHFNIFVKFGWIFFQVTLVGCFFNPKKAGGSNWPPCGFFKNVSSSRSDFMCQVLSFLAFSCYKETNDVSL